jgi:hypothetical protein
MNIQVLINRAININLKPAEEWQVIANETTDKNQIITGYALPLTILVGVAYLLGGLVFPFLGIFSITYIVGFAVMQFLISLFSLIISAFIITAITSNFGSINDSNTSFRWVIYSSTPFWLIGILVGLIPALAIIGIVGLYGFYLLWAGASPVMKTPEEKKPGFVIVSILIMIAVYAILFLILNSLLKSFVWGAFSGGVTNYLH